jgi:hypothetical protein
VTQIGLTATDLRGRPDNDTGRSVVEYYRSRRELQILRPVLECSRVTEMLPKLSGLLRSPSGTGALGDRLADEQWRATDEFRPDRLVVGQGPFWRTQPAPIVRQVARAI